METLPYDVLNDISFYLDYKTLTSIQFINHHFNKFYNSNIEIILYNIFKHIQQRTFDNIMYNNI